MKIKSYKQIKISEFPKGISADRPLMATDLLVKEVENLLGVEFEQSEGVGGSLEDCMIVLNDSLYVYIHKWEFD